MRKIAGFLCLIIYLVCSSCTKPTDNAPSNNTPQLFVPTAFTPNNDGTNDKFVIKATPPLTFYHIKIYDNANIKLYESSDYLSGGWDGNTNAQPEPAGSYLWSIEYQADGSSKITQNGYVQLIR